MLLTGDLLEKLRPLVAQGVERLDEYFLGHDWVHKIDWAALDMEHHLDCVLGQLFGSFGQGCISLRVSMDYEDYGFDIDLDGTDGMNYPTLQIAWLEVRDAVG